MGRKTITSEITDHIEDMKEKSQCSPLASPATVKRPRSVAEWEGRCVADLSVTDAV